MTNREIVVLVVLSVIVAACQAVAAGMLSPVLQYIEYGNASHKGGIFGDLLYRMLDVLGLKASLFNLLLLAFVPVLLREVVYLTNVWYSADVLQKALVRLRSRGFAALVHGDLAFVVGESSSALISPVSLSFHR